MYTIKYKGKAFSLNQAYNLHWTKSKAIKDELKAYFHQELDKLTIPPIDQFKINLTYNSRLDCDNTTPLLKVFVDVLRARNIIKDDTKEFYKGVSIDVDLGLEKNSYIIKIFPI